MKALPIIYDFVPTWSEGYLKAFINIFQFTARWLVPTLFILILLSFQILPIFLLIVGLWLVTGKSQWGIRWWNHAIWFTKWGLVGITFPITLPILGLLWITNIMSEQISVRRLKPINKNKENQTPQREIHDVSQINQSDNHELKTPRKITSDPQKLDPIEFEQFVGSVFEQFGYTASMTPRSGDGGVDLYIKKGDKKGIVQCKRHNSTNTVGEPTIRDLYGTMMHQEADIVFLVTSGKISAKAYKFAEGKAIKLIDGQKLSEIVSNIEFIG